MTSLFSGLAFTGMVYTLIMQKQELTLSRESINIQNEELKQAAIAQTQTVHEMQKQNDLNQTNFQLMIDFRNIEMLYSFLDKISESLLTEEDFPDNMKMKKPATDINSVNLCSVYVTQYLTLRKTLKKTSYTQSFFLYEDAELTRLLVNLTYALNKDEPKIMLDYVDKTKELKNILNFLTRGYNISPDQNSRLQEVYQKVEGLQEMIDNPHKYGAIN